MSPQDYKSAYERGFLISQHEHERAVQPIYAALNQAQRRGDRYRTLAITGLVVSAIAITGHVVRWVRNAARRGSPS